MTDRIVRVLLWKEEDVFLAQCLEHDICVQAPDIETLQRRFEATIAAEGGRGDLESIPPAPEDFQDKWASAEAVESDVENTEMRLAA